MTAYSSTICIRNYCPSDWEAFLQLHREAEEIDRTGAAPSAESLKEQLQRPSYSPEKNLFVAEKNNKLMGFIDVNPEIDIGRVVVACLVHPAFRKRKLATSLLGYAQKRAKELGVKLIHTNIQQDNEVGKAALTSLGFSFIRSFLEMERKLIDDDKANPVNKVNGRDGKKQIPSCVSYSHLLPHQAQLLTNLQNKAFNGSWGFNPNTVEEISFRLNLSGSAPKDVIVAWDRSRAVGYCWTRRDVAAKEGEIHMLGVHPEYRGRSIGRGLIEKAASHLKKEGMDKVKITVDKNNSPAYRLYCCQRFEERQITLWYEKTV